VADDGLQRIVQNIWPEVARTIGGQTVTCDGDKMKIVKASVPDGSGRADEMVDRRP